MPGRFPGREGEAMGKDTLEVGKKLVELCRKGKNIEAVDTLYAEDVVSLEAHAGPDMPARLEGLDAIRSKNKWFMENHDVHAEEVTGPFPHGDRFIVSMHVEVTPKVGPKAGE